MNKKTAGIIVVTLLLIAGFAVLQIKIDKEASLQPESGQNAPVTPIDEEAIESAAQNILTALKNKDIKTFASYAHPAEGVRFSVDAYLSKEDVVIKTENLEKEYSDPKIYLWGYTDGKGDPIQSTFKARFDNIYGLDYLGAPNIGYDKIIQKGNTIVNIREFYPQSHFVEYNFPGFDPKYGGMDWTSLRLIFEKSGGRWYLIAITPDYWTI